MSISLIQDLCIHLFLKRKGKEGEDEKEGETKKGGKEKTQKKRKGEGKKKMGSKNEREGGKVKRKGNCHLCACCVPSSTSVRDCPGGV